MADAIQSYGIKDKKTGAKYAFKDEALEKMINEEGFEREAGIGGIRYANGKLQHMNEDGTWDDVSGGSEVALGDVQGATATPKGKTVKLTWSDPSDVVISGATLAAWAGTKVVRKAGSAPANASDGTLVIDSKTRDAYSSTAFVDSDESLEYDVTYYYRFFPYTTDNVVTAGSSVTAVPYEYRIMTVELDFSNSDPTTWATYKDDAVGMSVGAEDWDEFFGHYECMLLNGVEGAKLNPKNVTQHLDGTNADVTTGAEGDAMVKFPRRGIKITTTGQIVSISMTDGDDIDGFQYKAHYYKGKKCSAFYRGIYKGSEQSSKLWSLSGKSIAANKTIAAFRTLAQAKGTNYEQSAYHQMTFLQVMYLLKYKGANAQTAIGRGYVDGNSAAVATGGANARGRDWGESTGKYQMKFAGQEDFFGNIWEWLEGLVTNASRQYLVCDTTKNISFTDAGTGYELVGGGFGENKSGYINKVIGTNDGGFLCTEFSGSETTYLCDYAYMYASCVAIFGGHWDDASAAGAFFLNVTDAASYSDAHIGSRLMFFELEDEEAA